MLITVILTLIVSALCLSASGILAEDTGGIQGRRRQGCVTVGKADEDDYKGFPKVIMYFAGDEVFAGIAPDYEKSFMRCGVKDYEIKIKPGMFHAWPVFTFTKEGREGDHRGYQCVL